MREPALGVVAFFLANDGDRPPAKARETGNECGILGKQPIAGERREFFEKRVGVVGEMRPRGMAGHERLLPGRELRVGFSDERLRLRLQPGYIVLDMHRGILRRELAQFLDLSFQFGDRLFEIQIDVRRVHVPRARIICICLTMTSAWRIEAASIKHAVERNRAQPFACASLSAARIASARATSFAGGV